MMGCNNTGQITDMADSNKDSIIKQPKLCSQVLPELAIVVIVARFATTMKTFNLYDFTKEPSSQAADSSCYNCRMFLIKRTG